MIVVESFVYRSDLLHPRRIEALSQRSDGRGLAQLALHAGMLAATGLLVFNATGTLWLLPAMVLHGVVLVFLFAALHECTHHTAFEGGWLNELVAWVAGFLLVLPPLYFRCFHFTHHRFTQDPARDPELAVPKPRTLARYLWLASGLPYWGERLATTLRHAMTGRIEEPFIPKGARRRVTAEARILWAGYVSVAALSWVVDPLAPVLFWIVPALLGQPFLRLYLLAEHTGCPMVDDMLANTRTTLTNRVVRRLAWNMPYHVEHHLFPAIPFYALPAVNMEVQDRLPVVTPGYWAFHHELLHLLRTNPPRLSGHPG